MARCDPWPLNPKGELLLGVKLESPEGVANCEEILAVPGLGFAEIGPGDLSLSLGYRTIPASSTHRKCKGRATAFLAACRKNGVAFLQGCTPDNIIARIDEGVRVIAGHSEASAIRGRAHQSARCRCNTSPMGNLSAWFAAGRIDKSHLAGRKFRRCVGEADSQGAAGERLAKAHRRLGADGSAIVCGILIDGMSIEQIAELRCMAGEERYSLWVLERGKRICVSGARTQIIGAQ